MDLDNNRKLIAAALAAVGSGDPNALQTVYRLTATKLFAVCLRILGDRSEAEDVLQEVYMTVWRKAAAFDPALSSPMRTCSRLPGRLALSQHGPATSGARCCHRRRRPTHFCCRHRRQTRGDHGGAGGLSARPDARPRAVAGPARR